METLILRILLPIKTVSEANLRDNWRKRARRTRKQREAARIYVRARLRSDRIALIDGRLIVSLTRIAPRVLDSDNLTRSMKAVRDGIADALGIDDGSSLIDWRYAQEKGKPKQYAVLVEITWQRPETNISA